MTRGALDRLQTQPTGRTSLGLELKMSLYGALLLSAMLALGLLGRARSRPQVDQAERRLEDEDPQEGPALDAELGLRLGRGLRGSRRVHGAPPTEGPPCLLAPFPFVWRVPVGAEIGAE